VINLDRKLKRISRPYRDKGEEVNLLLFQIISYYFILFYFNIF